MTLPGSNGEHALQERYSTGSRALAFYRHQVLDYVNAEMRAFLARQEMVFVATADARGECDCSVRVGPPGFVRVLDEISVAYPEYRGNGVLATLGNLAENPHVALLFLDFFASTVGLHVNGRARIVENPDLLAQPDLPPQVRADVAGEGGRKPERWVVVEVVEAYIHCSKHIPLLQKLDKAIHWGTDDAACKGGDYFKARKCPRPWNGEAAPPTARGA